MIDPALVQAALIVYPTVASVVSVVAFAWLLFTPNDTPLPGKAVTAAVLGILWPITVACVLIVLLRAAIDIAPYPEAGPWPE
ncbi:MAG TPA: hypothetical protein EYP14_01555 [Planctomycetaceae bacterium]|nr:hypothetical protein [Planctomycetaceae bacterium]